ncbi:MULTISPECIES: DoxX family protein [unclassified Rhodococcus (in: high G+C Gram-positive bacteria)]|nr:MULTISPECIES: DoxX family protein [unclassified Rhodococcus (in: high G+C Gram-positive bacteria)]
MTGHGNGTATDVGLLLLRSAVGGTLFAHGAQKLFGWFGGPGLTATAGGMQAMGFEPGRPSAVVAGVSETAGALMIAGIGTRACGALGAAAMVSAAAVSRPSGFFAQNGGYEYPAVLAAACTALTLTGPGAISIDARTPHALDRERVALAITVGAVSVSLGVVRARTLRLKNIAG